MLEKTLKSIANIPTEIFEDYLLDYLSKKDLFLLSQVNSNHRELVIKSVFKNNEKNRYEQLIDQYLSFWLANLHFVFCNKPVYQSSLLAYCAVNNVNSFQKMKACYLLDLLFYNDSFRKSQYFHLSSLLETHFHKAITNILKEIVILQLVSDPRRVANFCESLKKILFDNELLFREKIFILNIFKYLDNSLVHITLNQLKIYALTHIGDDELQIRKKSTTIFGVLSSAINFELRSQFINLLLMHSLFEEEFWLRKETFYALSALAERLTKEALIPVIGKIVQKLNNPEIFYGRKEYASKFLSKFIHWLSNAQIDILFSLTHEAHYQKNHSYEVWKINLEVLESLLPLMSNEQLLKTVVIFYELLAVIGTPVKLTKLAHKGLMQIAEIQSEEKICAIMENFLQEAYPDNANYSVSYLQVLSYLSKYMTDAKLIIYLNKLFTYLVHDNPYISDKAYQALKVLLKNLSGLKINLVTSILLEKLNDRDSATKIVSIQALALFAVYIPHELSKEVTNFLLKQIDNKDFANKKITITLFNKIDKFSGCEAIVYALRAFIIQKKIVPTSEIIDFLLTQTNHEDLGIREACIRTLVVSISFIDQEKINKLLIPILLKHIKHEDEEIQIIGLDAIAELCDFVIPETFIAIIYPIFFDNIKKKMGYIYEATLFAIKKFKPSMSFSNQQEFVEMLIKNLVDVKNYSNSFEKILETLSNFLTCISQAQQALIKAATHFNTDIFSLTNAEQKVLRKRMLLLESFWEQLYAAQVGEKRLMDEEFVASGKGYLEEYRPLIEALDQNLENSKELNDKNSFSMQDKKLDKKEQAKTKQIKKSNDNYKNWGIGIAVIGILFIIANFIPGINQVLGGNVLLTMGMGFVIGGGSYLTKTNNRAITNTPISIEQTHTPTNSSITAIISTLRENLNTIAPSKATSTSPSNNNSASTQGTPLSPNSSFDPVFYNSSKTNKDNDFSKENKQEPPKPS